MSTQKKIIKKKLIKKVKDRDKIYEIIPLLLIIGIVPLVLYLKEVTMNDLGNQYWDGKTSYLDVFSYYKMVFLLMFSAAGLLIFSINRKGISLDAQRKANYIPVGIYLLFVLLSAMFSEFKTVAFWGYRDRFEGAFVIMAYVVIMLLAMNVIKDEKSIKLLFICFISSAFIISLLGALQLFGLDYFKAHFFNSLITPMSLKAKDVTVSTNFPLKTIFTTLYNSNYVGSYMALLLPILLVFLVWAKRTSHRLIIAMLLCLAAINAVGCGSSAGLVGDAASILVIIVMFRKKILQHKKAAIIAVILLCGGLTAANFSMKGAVFSKIMQITSLSNTENVTDSKKALVKALQGLTDVSIDKEKMKIITEQGTLQISLTGGKLSITDTDNKELAYNINNNNITFNDTRFQHIKLNAKPEKGLIETYYNDYHLIDIFLTKEGIVSNTNRWMIYRSNKAIVTFGFEGRESMGTNRGYIWSRTIPLLKDTILLGHGPDTFPMYFPQYDFIGKLRNYETAGIYVDKPHNMYLQTAVNTGVISLLALLVLFGIYFVSSIRIYIREEFATFLPIAGFACFAAFCGYTVSGMFNDSVVSVAPVFWVFLGLGTGINFMLKEKMSPDGNIKKIV